MLGTAKLRHRKSISQPTMRGGDVSKRILMEFTIASNEIQHIVIRNSKLAGQSRSASKWISWHRRITPTVYPEMNSRDIKNSGFPQSTNRERMHRCDFDQTSEPQSQSRTVSTENQEKNVQNLFFFNNIKDGTLIPQVIQKLVELMSSIHFLICCSSFSLTAGGDLLNRRKGCKQYTSYVTFSHAVNTHSSLHIALNGSRMCWCASSHLHGHPCRAPECCPFFDSLFLPLFLSVCFSYPFFFYLNLALNLFLHVDVIGAISHWDSAN